MGNRIAVDIGGTFTDLVVESESGTEVSKVLSTPEDLVEGVLNAVEQAGADLADVDLFIHGTTVGLNTFLERSGGARGPRHNPGVSGRLPDRSWVPSRDVRPEVSQTRPPHRAGFHIRGGRADLCLRRGSHSVGYQLGRSGRQGHRRRRVRGGSGVADPFVRGPPSRTRGEGVAEGAPARHTDHHEPRCGPGVAGIRADLHHSDLGSISLLG